MKLKTNYLGIELNSPIIMGSSGLSKDVKNIKLAEESGAGAVVLKSLFEEQIIFETNKSINQSLDYPEAADYIKNYSRHNSLNEYLELIKAAKKIAKIPIIASINCVSDVEWEDFTKQIEKAGADAIELNINILPFDPKFSSAQIEEKYFNIIEQVKQNTKLKFAVKIGNHFTNLPNFIQQMSFRGVSTFVLFNKFYEPVIDTKKLQLIPSVAMSTESDIKHSLRWVALIKGLLPDTEISASTGIHSANTVIQQLLAGATTVQLCSVLYKKGINEINTISNDMIKWMEENSFVSVNDFRGKLSYANIEDKQSYERFSLLNTFLQ